MVKKQLDFVVIRKKKTSGFEAMIPETHPVQDQPALKRSLNAPGKEKESAASDALKPSRTQWPVSLC